MCVHVYAFACICVNQNPATRHTSNVCARQFSCVEQALLICGNMELSVDSANCCHRYVKNIVRPITFASVHSHGFPSKTAYFFM